MKNHDYVPALNELIYNANMRTVIINFDKVRLRYVNILLKNSHLKSNNELLDKFPDGDSLRPVFQMTMT